MSHTLPLLELSISRQPLFLSYVKAVRILLHPFNAPELLTLEIFCLMSKRFIDY